MASGEEQIEQLLSSLAAEHSSGRQKALKAFQRSYYSNTPSLTYDEAMLLLTGNERLKGLVQEVGAVSTSHITELKRTTFDVLFLLRTLLRSPPSTNVDTHMQLLRVFLNLPLDVLVTMKLGRHIIPPRGATAPPKGQLLALSLVHLILQQRQSNKVSLEELLPDPRAQAIYQKWSESPEAILEDERSIQNEKQSIFESKRPGLADDETRSSISELEKQDDVSIIGDGNVEGSLPPPPIGIKLMSSFHSSKSMPSTHGLNSTKGTKNEDLIDPLGLNSSVLEGQKGNKGAILVGGLSSKPGHHRTRSNTSTISAKLKYALQKNAVETSSIGMSSNSGMLPGTSFTVVDQVDEMIRGLEGSPNLLDEEFNPLLFLATVHKRIQQIAREETGSQTKRENSKSFQLHETVTDVTLAAEKQFGPIVTRIKESKRIQNIMHVLQRWQLAFLLPINMKPRVGKEDYDAVLSDYNRVRMQVQNSDIDVFRQLLDDIDKVAAEIREEQLKLLTDTSMPWEKQKLRIHFLEALRKKIGGIDPRQKYVDNQQKHLEESLKQWSTSFASFGTSSDGNRPAHARKGTPQESISPGLGVRTESHNQTAPDDIYSSFTPSFHFKNEAKTNVYKATTNAAPLGNSSTLMSAQNDSEDEAEQFVSLLKEVIAFVTSMLDRMCHLESFSAANEALIKTEKILRQHILLSSGGQSHGESQSTASNAASSGESLCAGAELTIDRPGLAVQTLHWWCLDLDGLQNGTPQLRLAALEGIGDKREVVQSKTASTAGTKTGSPGRTGGSNSRKGISPGSSGGEIVSNSGFVAISGLFLDAAGQYLRKEYEHKWAKIASLWVLEDWTICSSSPQICCPPLGVSNSSSGQIIPRSAFGGTGGIADYPREIASRLLGNNGNSTHTPLPHKFHHILQAFVHETAARLFCKGAIGSGRNEKLSIDLMSPVPSLPISASNFDVSPQVVGENIHFRSQGTFRRGDGLESCEQGFIVPMNKDIFRKLIQAIYEYCDQLISAFADTLAKLLQDPAADGKLLGSAQLPEHQRAFLVMTNALVVQNSVIPHVAKLIEDEIQRASWLTQTVHDPSDAKLTFQHIADVCQLASEKYISLCVDVVASLVAEGIKCYAASSLDTVQSCRPYVGEVLLTLVLFKDRLTRDLPGEYGQEFTAQVLSGVCEGIASALDHALGSLNSVQPGQALQSALEVEVLERGLAAYLSEETAQQLGKLSQKLAAGVGPDFRSYWEKLKTSAQRPLILLLKALR